MKNQKKMTEKIQGRTNQGPKAVSLRLSSRGEGEWEGLLVFLFVLFFSVFVPSDNIAFLESRK